MIKRIDYQKFTVNGKIVTIDGNKIVNEYDLNTEEIKELKLLVNVFTKDEFVSALEALQKQYDHDQKCSDAMEVIFPNDFISGYDNHWLTDKLVELLEYEMNDWGRWINYFIYELDFGKKWKPGTITENGKDIPLRNAEELYDILRDDNIDLGNYFT
jgi:hypothetical protein